MNFIEKSRMGDDPHSGEYTGTDCRLMFRVQVTKSYPIRDCIRNKDPKCTEGSCNYYTLDSITN